MYILAPFILQNFKKILRVDLELWGCAIFRPKMTHLSWTKFFWYKPLLLLYHYIIINLLALFIVQKLKKFLQQIQSYEDAKYLGPKWPISPNENFFRKPVNKPCLFHSCLSTSQKSKSDINLSVKYWQSKHTEISLAKTHFWL